MEGKIEDGQLSNSPLSLHDIDGISDAFLKVLRGVFHERIEYPTVHVERKAEEDAHAADEAGDAMPEPYTAPMPDGLVPANEEPAVKADRQPAAPEEEEKA